MRRRAPPIQRRPTVGARRSPGPQPSPAERPPLGWLRRGARGLRLSRGPFMSSPVVVLPVAPPAAPGLPAWPGDRRARALGWLLIAGPGPCLPPALLALPPPLLPPQFR